MIGILLNNSIFWCNLPMGETSSSEQTLKRLQLPVDRFTFDFLRKISKDDKNIFVSPIGIIVLYTILLEGAHGKTADQIMEVFHLKDQFKNINDVRITMEELIKRLDKRDQDLTIKMANKALINKDIKLKQQFQEIIQKNYSALIEQEDLTKKAIIKKLNKWVSQETNKLIPQMFTQPFGGNTILVLLNVLYFKGLWMEVFKPCKKKQYFHNLDGTKKKVRMMENWGIRFDFSYLEEEKLKIVRLPYKKGASMYIFMPLEVNGIQAFIDNLDAQKMQKYMQTGRSYELSPMRMPLLRLEDTHNLSEILPAMGLSLPFSNLADLTGITDGSLHISSSVQKTVIIVDEKGTEAAAATCIPTNLSGFHSRPEFILDRPFIFFIRDEEILINLFVGVVKNLPN
ncbi:serpin B13-like [Brevipalpus obovatus]|uniref:serpin B13-like n=1 Tax=Brevipalpus obovatus TaxID=246614 RepID=UPI003D9F13A0